MTCNVCNLEEATIHLTEIINSKMVELHLCEQCAYEKGTDVKQYFNFSELVEGLTGGPEAVAKQGGKKEALRCKSCGISFDEFGKSGRLGCPQCYQTFAKLLAPLIKRIHRATQHVGKRPTKVSGEVKFHMELRELHERLRKLVEQEAFEDAARVRDQIRQLEERGKKGSEGNGS
ncbi:MAG: UvrB/UvrC motif-containing protein [Candidatus Omnitrophica bacterium]|nr:UvrB/UvrC motif-containing protein [Candidatus Omnitrophota bacterium]